MKEEWICQVLVDIMADRVVPEEEDVPVVPEWADRVCQDPGADFVLWATGLLPHHPMADREGHPGGAAAAACFR